MAKLSQSTAGMNIGDGVLLYGPTDKGEDK